MADNNFDVVIVGTGLAGLNSALYYLECLKHKLFDKSTPPRIAFLEADALIGGRTRSRDLHIKKAPHVSYGGTWVMLEDAELIALSNIVSYYPYQPLIDLNWSHNSLNITFVLYPYMLLKLWTIGYYICNDVEKEKEYRALDSLDLNSWADNLEIVNKQKQKEGVIAWFFQMENYPTDISKISTYFAAKSVYVRLSNFTETGLIVPKIMRWPNGTGAVIDEIKNRILDKSPNSKFLFHHKVTDIKQDDKGVEITTTLTNANPGQVEKFTAKRVVVATALTNAIKDIKYSPPLPESQTAILSSLQSWDDPALQIVMLWTEQFWKQEWRGTIIYPGPIPDDQKGVYGPVFDLSNDSKHTSSKIGITRIICKRSRCTKEGTDELLSEDEIFKQALNYLALFHRKGDETKEQTLKRITSYFTQEKSWVFDFSTTPGINAVTYFFGPSADQSYANHVPNLNEDFGNVIFAGSERAPRGFNWMEGAVLSGRMAALKLLQRQYGKDWTAEDENRFHAFYEKNLKHGLIHLKIQGVLNVPEYVKYLVNFLESSVHQIWNKIVHHDDHKQPKLLSVAPPSLGAAPAALGAAPSEDGEVLADQQPEIEAHFMAPQPLPQEQVEWATYNGHQYHFRAAQTEDEQEIFNEAMQCVTAHKASIHHFVIPEEHLNNDNIDKGDHNNQPDHDNQPDSNNNNNNNGDAEVHA